MDSQLGEDYFHSIQMLIRNFSVSGTEQDFFDNVVDLIQTVSGCRFIGIRMLDETGFIPYQSYVGFSQEFWEHENVLSGDKSIINPNGALVSNDTTLANFVGLTKEERDSFRAACVNAGNRSLAIIPIVYRNITIGVIHIADPLPNQISVATIEFVESIAPLIGEVIDRGKIEQSLEISRYNQEIIKNIVSGISSLAYVVNVASFEIIYANNSLFELSGQDFTGAKCYEIFNRVSACPDCPIQANPLEQCTGQCWERYEVSSDRYYIAEQKLIRWPDGKNVNAAFVSDITQQKQTEKALQAANTQLEHSVSELQDLGTSLEEEIMERAAAQEELNQKNEEFRKLAYFDVLTGLPNRAFINKKLAEEVAKSLCGEGFGVVYFIDLDDLKLVNDTFGHTYGDALICTAGQWLVREFGEGTFVGRIGGDEFMVIVPGERDPLKISHAADRIIKLFDQEIEVLGVHFHVSASLGIASYPENGVDAEEIFKNADNAMYAAKKSGKNRWRFYKPEMQMEAYGHILLSYNLRKAVEQDEFFLHYQPLVQISNGSIIGFEALIRWNSSFGEPIPPLAFIPLAEQNGLIHAIGKSDVTPLQIIMLL